MTSCSWKYPITPSPLSKLLRRGTCPQCDHHRKHHSLCTPQSGLCPVKAPSALLMTNSNGRFPVFVLRWPLGYLQIRLCTLLPLATASFPVSLTHFCFFLTTGSLSLHPPLTRVYSLGVCFQPHCFSLQLLFLGEFISSLEFNYHLYANDSLIRSPTQIPSLSFRLTNSITCQECSWGFIRLFRLEFSKPSSTSLQTQSLLCLHLFTRDPGYKIIALTLLSFLPSSSNWSLHLAGFPPWFLKIHPPICQCSCYQMFLLFLDWHSHLNWLPGSRTELPHPAQFRATSVIHAKHKSDPVPVCFLNLHEQVQLPFRAHTRPSVAGSCLILRPWLLPLGFQQQPTGGGSFVHISFSLYSLLLLLKWSVSWYYKEVSSSSVIKY